MRQRTNKKDEPSVSEIGRSAFFSELLPMSATHPIPQRQTVLAILLILSVLCSTALAGATYQAGRLISVTDSRSNRAIGNSQNGSVVTVIDVEYRLSVEVGEMVYVGSYWPRTIWSYSPTDFIVNDPVQVKIDGKHMYLKRPDGKELKTTVLQRIRTKPNP